MPESNGRVGRCGEAKLVGKVRRDLLKENMSSRSQPHLCSGEVQIVDVRTDEADRRVNAVEELRRQESSLVKRVRALVRLKIPWLAGTDDLALRVAHLRAEVYP